MLTEQIQRTFRAGLTPGAHSQLPWHQSADRPHALVDATGESVLMAYPVAGGPQREIANLDLVERSVNGWERLDRAARSALGLIYEAARLGCPLPPQLERAAGLLREAVGEQAHAIQPA